MDQLAGIRPFSDGRDKTLREVRTLFFPSLERGGLLPLDSATAAFQPSCAHIHAAKRHPVFVDGPCFSMGSPTQFTMAHSSSLFSSWETGTGMHFFSTKQARNSILLLALKMKRVWDTYCFPCLRIPPAGTERKRT